MSDREKLIELVEFAERESFRMCDGRSSCTGCEYREYANCRETYCVDHLISNGVTVQKWIPVSERLPDVAVVKKTRYGNHTESVRVLCACEQESGKRMVKEGFCKVYANGIIYWSIPGTVDSVTHWREMPELPKECE